MARLFTTGFETGNFSEWTDAPWSGVNQGDHATIVTSPVHSGTYASEYTSDPDGNFVARLYSNALYGVSGGIGRTYYSRIYLRIPAAPTAQIVIFRQETQETQNVAAIKLGTDRKLGLYGGNTGAQIGSFSSALNVNQWYSVELGFRQQAGGADYAELRIDGSSVASSSTLTFPDNTGPGSFTFGLIGGTGAADTIYIDNVAVNDSTTGTDNSWPAAIVPSIDATVTAVPADATASAPAPTVSISVSATVTAVPASATASVPTPTLALVSNASITAVPASATASAPAPTPKLALIAPAALATASASAPTPSTTSSTTVIGVPGTATASAPAPTVHTTSNATVVGVSALATASVPAPQATITDSNTVPVATAFASMPTPRVKISVQGVPATATASMPVPSMALGAIKQPPVASAVASMPVPTIALIQSASVTVVPATATASFPVPSFEIGLPRWPMDIEEHWELEMGERWEPEGELVRW